METYHSYISRHFYSDSSTTIQVTNLLQVGLYVYNKQYYRRTYRIGLTKLFLPHDYEEYKKSRLGLDTYYFHDMQSVLEDINSTVKNYYNFVNDGVDVEVYLADSENKTKPAPIVMETVLWNSSLSQVLKESKDEYILNREPLTICITSSLVLLISM